jgi:hypothetical protein
MTKIIIFIVIFCEQSKLIGQTVSHNYSFSLLLMNGHNKLDCYITLG